MNQFFTNCIQDGMDGPEWFVKKISSLYKKIPLHQNSDFMLVVVHIVISAEACPNSFNLE